MDLGLTDDQELFRETTRKFLESTCPVERVRELSEKESGGYEREWWRRGTELGWTSTLVPEELGGGCVSDHGLLDLVLVAEEMGRLVSPGPLVPTNVVAAALATSGSAAQRDSLLPGLLTGEAVAAWCLAAPAAGICSRGGRVEATRRGDGFVLDGTVGPVEAGAEADVLLITAETPEGLAQWVLPGHSPGVATVPAHGLDLVRRFAEVRLEQVEVAASAALGRPGQASADVERQVQIALVLQCAEMVGAIDAVFQLTLEYVFDRHSFGRPLASYQAIKHRFADMKLWLEAAHATAAAAARAVASESALAPELVSVAKSYIADHGPAILQDCVQFHGGIGVTWDHDLHLYLRRVVQDRSQLGTPAEHRERVAAAAGI